jgi:hypothetical protein
LDENDGIYNDNGIIRIRATAITTGALQVGGTAGSPDSAGVKFYVDMAGSAIRLGGFSVDSIYLVSNNNAT